jgi:endonuclease/exonuclease/phosphatase (EEP) superfamily protein YafD
VQLTAIAEWARQQTGSAVVLGDLNATPWSPYFRDLLRDGGLLNLQPGWGTFSTWPAQLPFLRIPLDHCLTTPGVGIVRKEVGSAVGGDHLPLIVDVAVFARDGK